MRYHLITYGCTLNHADSDVIRGILLSEGLEESNSPEDSDVIILNTCTVKGATEQKIIQKIKRLGEKPLVVAGCMGSANVKLIEKASPNACIVGPSSITHIKEAVLGAARGERLVFLGKESKQDLPRIHESVIARVPIAEGCLGACTFCQTRIARGELVSYPIEGLLAEVRRCADDGFKEIQLTAQDTGAYGKDIGFSLPELLERVDSVPGKFLTRIGMMNPQHLKNPERLIQAFSSSKIYKFFHIPVQSGSDSVLGDMNRFYSVGDFLTAVKSLRKAFPDLTLSTDIIVGFPSESEEAFKETLALIKEVKPDIVNISKFTPRPGTVASRMKELPNHEVKRRSEVMSALCKKIELEKNRELVGREFEVLVTELSKSTTGRNINYKQIVVEGELGEFVRARITGATSNYLVAKRV